MNKSAVINIELENFGNDEYELLFPKKPIDVRSNRDSMFFSLLFDSIV